MTALYKYLSKSEFVDSFLNEGNVFFQSLSHFTACEETQLRDKLEGTLLYEPLHGLKPNLASGRQISLPGALISEVRKTHRIYVFCTSLRCTNNLAQRFKSNWCVEISDLDEFGRRLAWKLRDPVQRFRNTKLLSGPVYYGAKTEMPGIDHALPEKIIFRKQETFSIETEYRFAFGLDANAFDAYNVDYSIGEFRVPEVKPSKPRILKIGPLHDICKTVSTFS